MSGFDVSISNDKDSLGRRGAAFVADYIRTTVATNGSARIIVATGASQFEFLQHLVAEPSVPWDKVTAFHLDEYVGMDEKHKASFRGFLNERFFNLIQPSCKEVHLLGGPTGKLDKSGAETACTVYGAKLLEGDIDIACIGIGENGHIAFNDPPVADFNDPVMVKVVPLDDACRNQQLGEGWFPTFDDVPTHAMSLTCPAIMRCKVISVHVPDERKADAVKGTITQEVR
jgi:glucosamine-6-phosphate deaminase